MIVVTCSTPGALTDETLGNIMAHWTGRGQKWDHIKIDPDDPHAYGEVLKFYWESGRNFGVVEPDIVIRKDVADAFLGCPEPYCAFPYNWGKIGPALGCTRFRREFIERYPLVMRKVRQSNVGWRQLDVVMIRHVLAGEYGQQPHVHLPPVEHLNAHTVKPDAPTELIVPTR